jgi:hypothetical protein
MRSTAIGLALSLLVCQVARSAPAAAQSAAQLDDARKLFADAVADQDAKRFDTALEKFQRVAAVKDTGNVRYRIASCLEALGRRAEALASYEAAGKLAEQEKTSPEVLRAARDRAADLDRTVPRLSVVLPADAPAATEVRVDDAPVDRSALAGMLLDVGHHTIRATAPGDTPFETAVTLPEGGHVSISVILTPVAPPAGPPAGAGQTPGQGPSGPSGDGEKQPPVSTHPSHVGAWIAIGVGGALAVGSVVSFVLRQSNIGTIDNDCSGSGGTLQCPSSKQSEVNDARNAAQWQGPLAIGLGAGAVVGLGIGAWLLATSPSQSVSVAPAFLRDGGLLVVQGRM